MASLAQRSQEKLHFDHKDMDYYLSWIMGREIYGGSTTNECLEVAARITNGDAQSWQREWRVLAEQVEEEAQTALAQKKTEEARSACLRACSYYRAPLFLMRPSDAAFDETVQKMQTCFRQAAVLFDPPLEPIEGRFEGHRLFGYAWRAGSGNQPRSTLVVFGGIETFAEDCYFMVGPEGANRGYTMLTVDLPGQGTTPVQGLYFGARMERPVRAVLDYALSRADVDPARLAIFGFSWGGHIVFKSAQHDPRVKGLCHVNFPVAQESC